MNSTILAAMYHVQASLVTSLFTIETILTTRKISKSLTENFLRTSTTETLLSHSNDNLIKQIDNDAIGPPPSALFGKSFLR